MWLAPERAISNPSRPRKRKSSVFCRYDRGSPRCEGPPTVTTAATKSANWATIKPDWMRETSLLCGGSGAGMLTSVTCTFRAWDAGLIVCRTWQGLQVAPAVHEVLRRDRREH